MLYFFFASRWVAWPRLVVREFETYLVHELAHSRLAELPPPVDKHRTPVCHCNTWNNANLTLPFAKLGK